MFSGEYGINEVLLVYLMQRKVTTYGICQHSNITNDKNRKLKSSLGYELKACEEQKGFSKN